MLQKIDVREIAMDLSKEQARILEAISKAESVSSTVEIENDLKQNVPDRSILRVKDAEKLKERAMFRKWAKQFDQEKQAQMLTRSF